MIIIIAVNVSAFSQSKDDSIVYERLTKKKYGMHEFNSLPNTRYFSKIVLHSDSTYLYVSYRLIGRDNVKLDVLNVDGRYRLKGGVLFFIDGELSNKKGTYLLKKRKIIFNGKRKMIYRKR